MRRLCLLGAALLLLILPGCSFSNSPEPTLPEAVTESRELRLETEAGDLYLYRRIGPGEAELKVPEGYAEGLCMYLSGGSVTVSLDGLTAELSASRLPESAPILEITRLLDGLASAESRGQQVSVRTEGEAEIFGLGSLGSLRVEGGSITGLLCGSGSSYRVAH